MNPISHNARTRRYKQMDGILISKDAEDRVGFTRLHAKGHVRTSAAIANCLRHAAAARHIPSDHAHFINKVRQLRKRGTWL